MLTITIDLFMSDNKPPFHFFSWATPCPMPCHIGLSGSANQITVLACTLNCHGDSVAPEKNFIFVLRCFILIYKLVLFVVVAFGINYSGSVYYHKAFYFPNYYSKS